MIRSSASDSPKRECPKQRRVGGPYYSRTTPIRIPKDVGIVWKAYYKGVPLLGVPGITPEASGVDGGEKKQTSYVFKTKVNKNISTSEP